MRVIIAARLSQLGKGQTGIDTQDEDAREWATEQGHDVIFTAVDRISGRVEPQKRPKLGPWMTDPKLMAQYDAILASKMDRFSRGRDWKFREWAEANDKKLIVVQGNLTWPPGPNDTETKQRWDALNNQSESEWQHTSIRYQRMQAKLRKGGFLVGRPVFGLIVVPVKGTDHSTLTPDPALIDYVRGMVERALNGDTLSSIGEWLESEGIEPPAGGLWSPKSVSQILRSTSLIGRRKQGKETLLFDSIIDTNTFDRLQAKLDSNPRRRGPVSRDPALLTGVIYCHECRGVMHRRRTVTKRVDGSISSVNESYRCDGLPRKPSRCKNMIPQAVAEARVNAWFTDGPINDQEWTEIRTTPADNHEDALNQNARNLADLDADAPDYDTRHDELRAERKRLLALPPIPPRAVEVKTGKKLRQHWAELTTTAERRAWLVNNGAKVYADWKTDTFIVDTRGFWQWSGKDDATHAMEQWLPAELMDPNEMEPGTSNDWPENAVR